MEQWQRIGEWFTTFDGTSYNPGSYHSTYYKFTNSADSPHINLGATKSNAGDYLTTEGTDKLFSTDGVSVSNLYWRLYAGDLTQEQMTHVPIRIGFQFRRTQNSLPNNTELRLLNRDSGREVYVKTILYNGEYYPHFVYKDPSDNTTLLYYPFPTEAVSGQWCSFEVEYLWIDAESRFRGYVKINGRTLFDFVSVFSVFYGDQIPLGPTWDRYSSYRVFTDPYFIDTKNVYVDRLITVSPEPPTVYITKSGSGPVTLTAHAGVDPNITQTVSYSWSTGDTTAAIQVDRPGIYTCTVTDSEGQSVTGAYFLLNEADFITSYLWSTGETTPSISVNSSGTYTVTATNADGLSSTASITVRVTQPALPYPLQSSYSQEHTPSIVRTQMLDKHARQRTLAGKPPRTVSCKYQLTQSQFDYWLETWRTTLKEGAEWFKTWLLGDDNVLEQKTVRLRNGEWSYSLIHHTDTGNLYELTMKFDVKEA